MYGSQACVDPLPYIVSYFLVFQKSAISPAFNPELLNLAVSLMSTCSFSRLFYKNQFMLISGGNIWNRCDDTKVSLIEVTSVYSGCWANYNHHMNSLETVLEMATAAILHFCTSNCGTVQRSLQWYQECTL